ncbi:hypothetical protein GQ473_02070 [archaeon]|nr:hypothetical protein [archaeon]
MIDYAQMVADSLHYAESGWKRAGGVNTESDNAKRIIPKMACIILEHKLQIWDGK